MRLQCGWEEGETGSTIQIFSPFPLPSLWSVCSREFPELGLSDLANKYTGFPVRVEFQINHNFCSIWPKYWMGHGYTKQNSLFIWNSNLTGQSCILGGIPTQNYTGSLFGKMVLGNSWGLGNHICYQVTLSRDHSSLTGIGSPKAASHMFGEAAYQVAWSSSQ